MRELYAASGETPDEEEIRAHLAVYEPTKDAEGPIMVLQENVTAVGIFFRMSTQWDTAGMSGMRVGLNYSSLESVINLLGLAAQGRIILDKIQVMERAALKVFLEKSEADQRQRKRPKHGS